MSKYNKLPKMPKEDCDDSRQSIPISKLCCIPILLENSSYKKHLTNLKNFEELLPAVQRNEIYQMLYMDKLLDMLREYEPPEQKNEHKDIMDVIMDKQPDNPSFKAMSAIMKYNRTGDFTKLSSLLFPGNPMLSMLMPMLSGKKEGMGAMESLLPMLMGGSGASGNIDMGMLSSLFGNLG